jgi:hypothetical protein
VSWGEGQGGMGGEAIEFPYSDQLEGYLFDKKNGGKSQFYPKNQGVTN